MSDGTQTVAENTGTSTATGSAGTEGNSDQIKGLKREFKNKLAAETKKAAEAAVSSLLDDLGIEDVDDLKERFASTQSQSNEQATELKKLQKQLAKLQAERDEAHQALQGFEAKERKAKIKSAVSDAADKLGVFAQDVYNDLIVNGLVDVDDGSVVVKDVDGDIAHGMTLEKLIKSRAAENQHWFKPSPNAQSGGGSKPPPNRGQTESSKPGWNAQDLTKALIDAGVARGWGSGLGGE